MGQAGDFCLKSRRHYGRRPLCLRTRSRAVAVPRRVVCEVGSLGNLYLADLTTLDELVDHLVFNAGDKSEHDCHAGRTDDNCGDGQSGSRLRTAKAPKS